MAKSDDKGRKNLAEREGDSPLRISKTDAKNKPNTPRVEDVVTGGQAGSMIYKNQQQGETQD